MRFSLQAFCRALNEHRGCRQPRGSTTKLDSPVVERFCQDLFDSITPGRSTVSSTYAASICPGDTNRRVGDLQAMGISDPANRFGTLLYVRSEADVELTEPPNQTMQRTATRSAITFSMINTLPLRLEVAPDSRSLSFSR